MSDCVPLNARIHNNFTMCNIIKGFVFRYFISWEQYVQRICPFNASPIKSVIKISYQIIIRIY